jgi:NADH dehydrogenase
MAEKIPHVLVIGAGFGGLEVCKQLKRTKARVSLVDRHNYHLFQPLLYQVATAALSPADIAYPVRSIFRSQDNVTVYLSEAQKVDLKQRKVQFSSGEMSYDYLVLATGATHSYFGNDQWKDLAPGLKSIDDATEIRKRILLAFEEAEHELNEAARRAKLTFVIVGGGPTGVELAGALKEIAADTIPDDFNHVDTKSARIVLVQGDDRLLSAFHPKLSASAKADLERMGVEVRLKSFVTSVDSQGVFIGTERLYAQNVFWAAGVKASEVSQSLGVPLDGSGRVMVAPDLSLPGHPEAFAIGDLAHVNQPGLKFPVPGVAQGAIQGGRLVGKILASEIAGNKVPRPSFVYKDKGSMATIGKSKAIGELGRFRITGFLAWWAWSILHVVVLVGFRNRLSVLLSWIWNYVFSARGARLVTGQVKVNVRMDDAPGNEKSRGA